jgi:hypothetical protein
LELITEQPARLFSEVFDELLTCVAVTAYLKTGLYIFIFNFYNPPFMKILQILPKFQEKKWNAMRLGIC